MQNAQQVITQNLQDWLKEKDISVEFDVSLVENPKFGDFTANIAMVAIKKVEGFSNPRDVAQSIVDNLQKEENIKEIFDKIEVAGPGFINFFLSSKYLQNTLTEIIQKDTSYGKSDTKSDHFGDASRKQKIMVEYTDPNPLKEFHIGHLYSNTVGESLSRLLEAQGAIVKRVCYQGDVGLHVAKAILGINTKLAEVGKTIEDLRNEFHIVGEVNSPPELDEQARRAQFLGQAYVLGAKLYESDENKELVNSINKKVYTREDPEINKIYDECRAWSLEYFETLYKRLGTKFDSYYFESEVGKEGIDIVKAHMGDVFIEDEGAIIFPKEKSGLHTRVFINSLGLPTYEAKELGLAPKKYQEFQYDQSIIITGNEIDEYFKVLLKALSLIEPELAAKTRHISHGMVRLHEGKMSSRTGNVITGVFLINAAYLAISKKMEVGHSMEDIAERADKIAVGAVKYSFLKVSIGRDFTFDLDESISLEGNSGPYLQYAYVRTQSVLGKAQRTADSGQATEEDSDKELRMKNEGLESEENELLRFLTQFPSIVTQSAEQFAPNLLCNYLFELSQKFNTFYQKCKIIGIPEEAFRLTLTKATGIVIKNGLNLLGIQTVEKM